MNSGIEKNEVMSEAGNSRVEELAGTLVGDITGREYAAMMFEVISFRKQCDLLVELVELAFKEGKSCGDGTSWIESESRAALMYIVSDT